MALPPPDPTRNDPTGQTPPELPPQGIGPHFQINADGKIDLAPPEALDRDGNHLPTLRSFHPELRALAISLAQRLPAGNNTHPPLGDRIAAYRALIDQDLDRIDFRLLYLAGLRLRNSLSATDRAIATNEFPTLNAEAREEIDSLLEAHGPFILATTAGAEAIAAAEYYERQPEEELSYRAAAMELAQSIRDAPDARTATAAAIIAAAVEEIGQGTQPARGAVVGRSTVRNVAITALTGATLFSLPFAGGMFALPVAITGGLVAWGGLKVLEKSDAGQHTLELGTQRFNSLTQKGLPEAMAKLRRLLTPLHNLVQSTAPILRRLSTRRFEENWIDPILTWIETRARAARRNVIVSATVTGTASGKGTIVGIALTGVQSTAAVGTVGVITEPMTLQATAELMILRGEAPPQSWRPFITQLDFSKYYTYETQAKVDVTLLADLTALQILNLDSAQIADLAPLRNLTALNTLYLNDNPRIKDLTPLSSLIALQFLSMGSAQASNLMPLSGLPVLQTLILNGHAVTTQMVAPFRSERQRLGLPEVKIHGIEAIFE